MDSKAKPFSRRMGPGWLWLLATLLIGGISLLTSFQPLWANIPFNVAAPILVLIFLKTVFFEKLKLGTLILMRALIVFAVLGLIPGNVYVRIVLAFLVINILEAAITDIKKKKYYNAITGIALAASVFLVFGDTSSWIDPESWYGPYYVAEAVNVAGTLCWIAAYTVWNWLFVTHEFSPSISCLHIGILLVPLLGMLAFLSPGLWLIFRANSLTIGGVLQISCKPYLEDRLRNERIAAFISAIGSPRIQAPIMAVNLVLIAVPLLAALAG